MRSFSSRLPGEPHRAFRSAVEAFALDLYRRASPPDTAYFLDKTPRYALLADEVYQAFPTARFIVLWRNPLLVAHSIVKTWGGGHWNFQDFTIDLHDGLRHLLDFSQTHDANVFRLRFEDLVRDPEGMVSDLLDFLEMDPDPSVTSRFSDFRFTGHEQGDPTGQFAYDTIEPGVASQPPTAFNNPYRRWKIRRWLENLPDSAWSHMGYERANTLDLLRQGRRLHPNLVGDLSTAAKIAVKCRLHRLAVNNRLYLSRERRPYLYQ